MKVVTDKGQPVKRGYDLVDKYPSGSDLDLLGGDTLRRLVLQIRQKHIEEISSHRKVIREQEAELQSCMSDNRMLSHDLNELLSEQSSIKAPINPKQDEDDGA